MRMRSPDHVGRFHPPRRTRAAVAAVGVVVLLGALGACSKNTGTKTGTDNSDLNRANVGVISTNPKDSQGPAPAVAGAKSGGTLRIIKADDYVHLDPQENYTLPATALGQLIYRTLTAFREDGKGHLTLVGDLATDPGTDVSKDCTTWKYTIKSGLKFEDGSPLTAKDISYGIARSFSDTMSDGATYIQSLLAGDDYSKVYPGPWSGNTTVPGLDVPDDHTLVFHLKKAYCDFPFAASQNTTVPVPQSQDTKENYDNRPFASGPYKIKEYKKGSDVILERNPNWDPATDPIRHNYPDAVDVEIGPDVTQATERVLASSGDDAYAVNEDGVASALVPQARQHPAQLIDAPTSLVWRLDVNNDRIKDLKVREAIAYALDKQDILTAFGGEAAGKLTDTVLPPSTIGYQPYPAPFDGGATGNPDKAKALLAGQQPKLVMLVRQVDDPYLKAAQVVKTSLEKAGFQVVLTPIVRANHNPTTKTRGNEYDIYMSNWQPDWPSAASTLPVLFDGSTLGGVGSKGNNDTSYLNESSVNSEIARIGALGANAAAPEWMKLDQKIMSTYCPTVPIFTARTFAVNGTKVGGVFNSDAIGQQIYYDAYLKS
jgi:peptide/nickel transport system substrate-binding protein